MIQSPLEIIEKIRNVPPFQKVDAEASYAGQSIQWRLYFESIYQTEKTQIWHVMTTDSEGLPWVDFDVNIEKYPEFKIIHQKDELIVNGVIEKVSGFVIYLSLVNSVTFTKIPKKRVINTKPITVDSTTNISEVFWYQKPYGIFLIGTLVTVAGGGILYFLGWTGS